MGVYTRGLQRLGHSRWFPWITKHGGSQLDRALYRLSGGRLWLSGRGIPTMLLTTTGRKTGNDRTVPVYFVRDGENLVATCTNLGSRRPSSWPKNLFAQPNVSIQVGRAAHQYRARLATEQETARNWPRLIATWPALETYVERSQQLYVFVFEPILTAG